MHTQQDLAIQAALDNNWELAIDINLAILENDEFNIAALNRLGRAYTELDQKAAAKTVYQKVLIVDKYNRIALRNLKLLPHQKGINHNCVVAKEDFIEEPGLTKTVQLIKVADRDTLLNLSCKQPLILVPRQRLIAITTSENIYIGTLPDDLSLKIKSLLKSGYVYTACLKGASDNTVAIFVRELKRPNRRTALPTFSHPLTVSKTIRRSA